MKRMRLFVIAAAPLMLVCLTSVGEAQSPLQPRGQNPLLAKPAAQPKQSAIDYPPLEELQATRERPLFNPNRRPPAAEPENDAPPPIVESSALPFELTGVAVGPDVRVAILRNKGSNEEARLKEGDKLEAWTVEIVTDRYVVLRGDGKRVRLWLFNDASKKSGIEVKQIDGTDKEETKEEDPGENATPAQGGGVDEDVIPNAAPQSKSPGAAVAPPQQQVPGRPKRVRPPGQMPQPGQAPPRGRVQGQGAPAQQ
jgi:hypothetical protein